MNPPLLAICFYMTHAQVLLSEPRQIQLRKFSNSSGQIQTSGDTMIKSLLFLLLVAVANAKRFQRCEWAHKLKDSGMDGYRNVSLADWVCLTKWESGYDTMKTHHNNDGSTDFGIFQINNRWWCNDKIMSFRNGCQINCKDLLSDDVTVAINCAKRVVRDPQGIAAWYGWRNHCQGRDLTPYLDGCGL
ncbi:hypothetical protein ACER0C_004830 [Sarotherodon galilaeus]